MLDIDYGLIVVFISGIMCGFFAGEWWMRQKVITQLQLQKEQRIASAYEIVSNIPKITVEQHDTSLLAYLADTRAFVCQGTSMSEIAQRLQKDAGMPLALVAYNGVAYICRAGVATEVEPE